MSDYVFTNENGELMHPDTFSRHLRQLYDENGFPREFHLHTLRHYFVSTMLHNGVDKQTVAELAGPFGRTGFQEWRRKGNCIACIGGNDSLSGFVGYNSLAICKQNVL